MWATNIKNLFAVSVFILTIVYMATPAWADVNITAAQFGEPCDGRVMISFDATSETNLVRAFALDIRLDNDANIIEVTGISPDYYIFPGTIQIDAFGNVIDYGTAVAEYGDLPSGTLSGLDSNGITIEMASLYAPVGPGSPNAPAKSGDLLSIRIGGELCGPFPTNAGCAPVISCSSCLTISANVARAGPTGVVMEDPNEVVNVNVPVTCLYISIPDTHLQCLQATDPGYVNWIELDCPACWCYRHQCQGDADGLAVFGRYVALADLNILKLGFAKSVAELASVPNGLCGDFDHTATFMRPVTLSDLNILKLNFSVPGLPDCSMTNINYYTEP